MDHTLGRRHTGQIRRPGAYGALLLGALLLGACGGSDSAPVHAPPPTGSSSPPSPPEPAPPSLPPGTLIVEVLGEDGTPLPGVSITLNALPGDASSASTGLDGTASIETVPGPRTLRLRTPGLDTHRLHVNIPSGGEARYRVRMLPTARFAPAMLPARIQPGSLSADGTELTLELGLVANHSPGFDRPAFPGAVPPMSFGYCKSVIDRDTHQPQCEQLGDNQILALEYNEEGAPADIPPANVAMLLVDHNGDTQDADTRGHRWRAARYFAREFTARSGGGLLAVAAFSGGPEASVPFSPLLLPPPVGNAGDPSALFTSGAAPLQDMLNPDHFTSNGNRDTPEAIAAALQLMAAHAPQGSRALVVITGPLESDPDDATLSRLAELRATAGAEVVLVSRPLEYWSVGRPRLAALASALQATTIVANLPLGSAEFPIQDPDLGLVQAMELATAWLTGEPLPTLKVTYRVKSWSPELFRRGELLRSEVKFEAATDICPGFCDIVPVGFAARIP
jgi:hypothetical protein